MGLEHGFKDATTDAELIRRRWEKYPFADIGCAIPSDIVVLDLDRGDSEDGFRDFLTRAGQATDKVETPQASSVSGGVHLYLDANGRRFRNKIYFDGTAMDVRTDCITLPSPRSGREWIKPLTLPLLPAPDWIPEDTAKERPPGERREFAGETPYAVAARESACSNIEDAPNKEQGDTLRRECYSIGGYVGGGELDKEATIAALTEAALKMPTYDKRKPWKGREKLVRKQVERGMEKPRNTPKDEPWRISTREEVEEIIRLVDPDGIASGETETEETPEPEQKPEEEASAPKPQARPAKKKKEAPRAISPSSL